MNFIYTSIRIAVIGVLLSLSACRHQDDLQPVDAQIGFYNASEYVRLQLRNNYKPSYVFIDTKDTVGSATTSRFATGDYINQFPNQSYYVNHPQPWLSYIRIIPGTHQLLLMDTGMHRVLVKDTVVSRHGTPMTVYFADNLGEFRTWKLSDEVNTQSDAIHLRVLDLSPDAGKIYLTINGHAPAGFPSSFQYGDVAGFIPVPVKGPDTLRIRFYHPETPGESILSTTLLTTPGGAYNIVVKGYENAQGFVDPASGSYLSFDASLKVALTQVR
ncbi:hypothetical protein [Chitinophaga sp. RAB17]|uniref:hypothetical protein n=1 Tax=Chitinophaga sp. RAB17 TaxID=3233049 RepID=UPI003F91780C